ncbi:AraC-type DNA-binding protein [Chitinophaga sp. CF118]|uniref:helix-turn-helix domain-containing protein n=1 Tax=Chitinophaga sp. CF118 TaxID=1884367 RepID=UPI0008E74165|nr:helix-turn-helix domain-containing protein [Chitinophaga sp. CF118]SFF01759.1 AraC-type DNA-binding protein [Chitinophaga sp. CF118]
MSKEIKKYEFKPGFQHEIEIATISDIFSSHTQELTTPHRAEFYHIFWFQKGTASHVLDFKPVKVLADSFLFVKKGWVQMFDQAGKYDGKVLLFTDKFFNKTDDNNKLLRSSILFNDLLDVPVIRINKSNQELVTIFRQLESEIHKNGDLFHYDVLHNFLSTFLLLAERERRNQGFNEIKAGPDLDYTTLFKDLLEEQYKTLKTVSGYASLIHTSEKRLTQATNQVLGKTPKQVIDERVMLEAKRLLAHTANSIKEIAYMLGFEEPTNFIKYFRKHEGRTPMEFKESI